MSTYTSLQKAISTLGGQVKLADAINTSQQNVSNWLRTGKVSPDKVILIEKVTGVSRYELRPDIYPLEESKQAA
ncbi:YdaS family helix-turn-helix protein [Pseudoalteromonas sp. NSLLW218]|uniref:transcriptional regulator n=1 Tax=Pseudoalteromonas sp. NSLLW218 TaxID=2792048 RepID=UPI0018CCD51E|nr:YdaS family helix-turn-helix protein [Pseudoalteromonas sp. NSLLW218]MBH0088623.1 helix-turn-helix domain-containing protein [Pseudoalteromonas sp. NSLLW218]